MNGAFLKLTSSFLTCPPAWKKEYLPAIRTYAEPPLYRTQHCQHSNPRCQECELKSRPKSPIANSGTGSMHTKAGRYQAQTITLENRNTLVTYGNMIMLTK